MRVKLILEYVIMKYNLNQTMNVNKIKKRDKIKIQKRKVFKLLKNQL